MFLRENYHFNFKLSARPLYHVFLDSSCDLCHDFIPNEQFSVVFRELSACISTEQAVKILDSLDEKHQLRDKIMTEIARRIQKNMLEWTEKCIEIEVIVFTKEQGLLGVAK